MNMKKVIGLIVALFIIILALSLGQSNSFDFRDNSETIITNTTVVEDGQYCDKENVSIYIKQFHKLPSNYITKSEAQDLGWHGGPLKKYAPGKSIGGDVFTNRQHILPEGSYIECDIDANGTSRGAKRIVYSTTNYKTYYTEDHYNSFTEI